MEVCNFKIKHINDDFQSNPFFITIIGQTKTHKIKVFFLSLVSDDDIFDALNEFLSFFPAPETKL